MKTFLLGLLIIVTFIYTALWFLTVRRARRTTEDSHPATDAAWPSPMMLGTGFLTDFLDTLGIGSFAVTTSIYKLKRMVSDELIPGTLNVGHALPTVAEALIYIVIVQVDVTTLALMIGSAVLGAWLGAGVVARMPKRGIQIGMGFALLFAAVLMLLTQLEALKFGSDTLGLTGVRLVIGVAGNFVLGALMTLGIGLYAPCMILVSLLGMNPTSGFPIMMGSCAFLMPVGGIRFIRLRRYNLRAALGLAIGGVPGVLLAAFIVRSLPLGAVRWLVIAIVVYAAFVLLQSARKERR